MPQSIARGALTSMITSAKRRLAALQQSVEADSKLIQEARERISRANDAIFTEQLRVQGWSELLIVDRGLSLKAAAVRDDILAVRKQRARTDITIARTQELIILETNLQKVLRGACPHPLLLSYDEQPNYGSDDASWPEERQCVVCGTRDRSKTLGTPSYETLSDSPERIVKRDLRRAEKGSTREEALLQEPLKYYLDMYRRSAGKLNAIWSDEETGKFNPPATANRK